MFLKNNDDENRENLSGDKTDSTLKAEELIDYVFNPIDLVQVTKKLIKIINENELEKNKKNRTIVI